MAESFNDRVGTHTFRAPSAVWGYLAQVNEWSRGRLTWKTVFVAGEAHMPVYRAIPVWNGEELSSYAREGPTKKTAMEAAAAAIAMSGHCYTWRIFPSKCEWLITHSSPPKPPNEILHSSANNCEMPRARRYSVSKYTESTRLQPPITPQRGYLAQIYDWANTAIFQWDIERTGGTDCTPIFSATPLYNEEKLVLYTCTGNSKKEARKNAEKALLNDGKAIRWSLEWDIARVESTSLDSHPMFLATPIVNEEFLMEYAKEGFSKREARELSAEAMAKSGHCVSNIHHILNYKSSSFRVFLNEIHLVNIPSPP
ncbi:hypothetical protein QCA50_010279 [Cerrena zonata]|uniref:Uncharacterized protein n=1 Tax=Cerrena zonata TaxID=2478898 RepID=A0AAW0G8X4_9APHY